MRAFKQAYQSLGFAGKIIATDIDSLAPALRFADCPYIVPRLDAPDYVSTLIDICRREQVYVIFPLIDPDIPVLALHRTEIQATGARLAVVPIKAVSTVNDKWVTTQFFQRLNLRTPRSWLPEQLGSAGFEYPLFIKPRNGSAAQNVFKARNERELDFFLTFVPNPLIQEFVTGPEITNDVICDLDGNVLSVVSRRRIEVRWGEVAKGVTVYDSQITDACVKIARELPAIGPITVQCILKDGVPHFTEINARLGGGIPLSIAAGADAPRWLLARAAGLPIAIPPLGSYKTGLYLTRFDESFFMSETEYAQMASHRL